MPRTMSNAVVAAVALLATLAASSAAPLAAAEVKLLAPAAMRAFHADLVRHVETTTGHKIKLEQATVGVITERLLKGEAADVAIALDEQIDDLQKAGKVAAGSKLPLSRVGYALFVKKGTPKPDVSTVAALRKTLLAAKSIAQGDPTAGGTSGIFAAKLMETLGIAAETKPKTKIVPPGGGMYGTIVSGQAEIGFGISNYVSNPEAAELDLVGLLPAEVQAYTSYAAGIVAATKNTEAAKAVAAALASPEAKALMKAKGFEPR